MMEPIFDSYLLLTAITSYASSSIRIIIGPSHMMIIVTSCIQLLCRRTWRSTIRVLAIIMMFFNCFHNFYNLFNNFFNNFLTSMMLFHHYWISKLITYWVTIWIQLVLWRHHHDWLLNHNLLHNWISIFIMDLITKLVDHWLHHIHWIQIYLF